MASVRQIRQRIRSVKNTARVTRAMQMVAASKTRRSQERVAATRPYAERLRTVMADLTRQAPPGETLHPLLTQRPVQRSLIVEITPDRGLCGGLPGNINRATALHVLRSPVPVSLITIGKKGRDFMVRAGRDVKATFTDLGDRPSLVDTIAITHLAERMFREGEVDEVFLAYTRFVNTITQEPAVTRVLPVDVGALAATNPGSATEYIYEPSASTVLGALAPRFLEVTFYAAILESIASEQSARMVAMRNATEAANDMVDELTLQLNKARQDSITKELLDIVGGVAALEG
ncbi:MAG: ATP synthase F1 subunit gamma [SAR202 cluster bacterium]|nr:ATP synthase F1 subunit gamma [SAR202 cluster bacterium]